MVFTLMASTIAFEFNGFGIRKLYLDLNLVDLNTMKKISFN